MNKIYICDIDGTLASHLGIRSPYDETKVHMDKPLPTCNVIKALIKEGNRIIFFSGRTRGCYQMTREWLQAHLNLFESPLELHMREVGDDRKDSIVKAEMYQKWILDRGLIIEAVFDDRLSVVKMWEEKGLFVFNCNQGLKEF